MIEAMRKYGGSFIVSLADCFMRADSSNFDKLCMAFPEYVEKYLAIAGRDATQQSMHQTGLTPRQKEEVEQIIMRALSKSPRW